MDGRDGAPPRGGWAGLAPELLVQDFAISLTFWTGTLGFGVAYQRAAELFAYLEHPDGAQVMLSQRSGIWETAALEHPFGRGVMLQLHVCDVGAVFARVKVQGWPIHHDMREVWRHYGDREGSQREFFLQDPDGYLLMIAQKLGERPLTTSPSSPAAPFRDAN
jgi:catechol 2,3-dioxygenase-like lactoylglutathione lyase family enzyme